MRLATIDESLSMNGINLVRECQIFNNESPLDILTENIEKWKEDNSIILVHRDIMRKIQLESYDSKIAMDCGFIFFDSTGENYLYYRVDNRTNKLSIMTLRYEDIEYSGPIDVNPGIIIMNPTPVREDVRSR